MSKIDWHIRRYWRRKTIQMIADSLNEPYSTVWDHCKRLGKWPVSPKDLKVDFIRQNKDKTLEEIAQELNCSSVNVRKLCNEYNIQLAPRF